MINELAIKEQIKEHLEKELPEFSVEDFPVNTFDYVPAHIDGEILLKSLGDKPVQNIDNNMDNLHNGFFSLRESQWRLELICKDFNNIDALYQMTYDVGVAFKQVNISIDYEFGKPYLVDITEPDYNEENNYQYRTLIFAIPYIYHTGE